MLPQPSGRGTRLECWVHPLGSAAVRHLSIVQCWVLGTQTIMSIRHYICYLLRFEHLYLFPLPYYYPFYLHCLFSCYSSSSSIDLIP